MFFFSKKNHIQTKQNCGTALTAVGENRVYPTQFMKRQTYTIHLVV